MNRKRPSYTMKPEEVSTNSMRQKSLADTILECLPYDVQAALMSPGNSVKVDRWALESLSYDQQRLLVNPNTRITLEMLVELGVVTGYTEDGESDLSQIGEKSGETREDLARALKRK